MPTLSGPEYLNGQFSVAADGTVSLTTAPLPIGGGSMTGPLTVNPYIVIGNPVTSPPSHALVINNAASTPQATTVIPQAWFVSEAANTPLLLDYYATVGQGVIVGRRARGTAAAPAAVQTFDNIVSLVGVGRGATGYGATLSGARFDLYATENWSDTAQGTGAQIITTTPGTTTPTTRFMVRQGVVIGNGAPDPGQGGLTINAGPNPPQAVPVPAQLLISNEGAPPTLVGIDQYGTSNPAIYGRRARGSAASPTAVQTGDVLFAVSAQGWGATSFNGAAATAALIFGATENYTDAARGSSIRFTTTPNGTASNAEAMRIDNNGNVGIGTTAPTEKFTVGGGIKVKNGVMTTNEANAGGIDSATGLTRIFSWGPDNTTQGAFQFLQQSANASAVNTPLFITTTGNVGIGTAGASARLDVRGQAAAGMTAAAVRTGPNGADSTSSMISFTDFGVTATVGGISRTGTNSVAYLTTSDARLKRDVARSGRGLDAVMAIKVSDYRMGDAEQQGLLAQDVAKVYPEAVHEGGKDPNLEPWMLDYGRLSPLLIKGMQQQQEMIAALQAKVAALESATVH